MVRSGGHTTVWLFAVVSLADTLPDQREQRVTTVRTKPPKSPDRLSPGAGANAHRRRLRSARRVSLRAAKIPGIQRGSRLGNGINAAAASGPFGNQGGTGHRSLSVKQIAERLLVRHHTAVGLVDRLVDLDMVIRTIDSADRRRIQVSLTKTGHSALHGLSAIHVAELKNIRPTLRKLLRQFET